MAGGVLYLWARLRGSPRPSAIEWRWAALLGCLFFLIGNGTVAFVEQRVEFGTDRPDDRPGDGVDGAARMAAAGGPDTDCRRGVRNRSRIRRNGAPGASLGRGARGAVTGRWTADRIDAGLGVGLRHDPRRPASGRHRDGGGDRDAGRGSGAPAAGSAQRRPAVDSIRRPLRAPRSWPCSTRWCSVRCSPSPATRGCSGSALLRRSARRATSTRWSPSSSGGPSTAKR